MNTKAYKALKYKDYELPSGFNIKVKSLSPYTILEIRNEMTKKNGKNIDLYSLPIINKLFKDFVVDPVIGKELEVRDFLPDDYNEIISMMFDQILLRESKRFKDLKSSDESKDFSMQSEQSANVSDWDHQIYLTQTMIFGQ